jgi:hypothetical protein
MKNKNLNVLFISVICIFTGIIVQAQSTDEPLILKKFGVGLHAEQYKISNVLTSSYYSAYTSTFLMPLNLTQHFRIEPEAGVLWMHDKDDDATDFGFSLGVGAFGMLQREKVNVYIGGRFILDKATVDGAGIFSGDADSETYRAFKFGPAFGFEYFLSKNFSFGGEIGMRYTSSKNVVKNPNVDDEISKAEMFNFDSGMYIRVFL